VRLSASIGLTARLEVSEPETAAIEFDTLKTLKTIGVVRPTAVAISLAVQPASARRRPGALRKPCGVCSRRRLAGTKLSDVYRAWAPFQKSQIAPKLGGPGWLSRMSRLRLKAAAHGSTMFSTPGALGQRRRLTGRYEHKPAISVRFELQRQGFSCSACEGLLLPRPEDAADRRTGQGARLDSYGMTSIAVHFCGRLIERGCAKHKTSVGPVQDALRINRLDGSPRCGPAFAPRLYRG
jgi:hypothetical protein